MNHIPLSIYSIRSQGIGKAIKPFASCRKTQPEEEYQLQPGSGTIVDNPLPSAIAVLPAPESCRTIKQHTKMLRQAARGLSRRPLALRSISTSTIARQDDEALPKAFSDKFVKFVPSTMAKPSFPTDFLPKEQKEVKDAPSSVPDKLTFNFYLPHEQIAKGKKVMHVQAEIIMLCCTRTKHL